MTSIPMFWYSLTLAVGASKPQDSQGINSSVQMFDKTGISHTPGGERTTTSSIAPNRRSAQRSRGTRTLRYVLDMLWSEPDRSQPARKATLARRKTRDQGHTPAPVSFVVSCDTLVETAP